MDERERIIKGRTPYEILGLSTSGTPEEAKYQYFKLVKRYSPEKDEEGFTQIRRAYEQLRDPQKKASVDVMLFGMADGRIRFAGVTTSTASLVKINREIKEAIESDGGPAGDSSDLVEKLKIRAVINGKNKRWRDVLADLDEISKLAGETEEVEENRCYVFSRQAHDLAVRAQYADASRLWRRAYRLRPERCDVLHNLAVCATLMMNRDDEDEYWVQTLRAWHQELDTVGDDPYLKGLIVETHKRFGGRYLNRTGDEKLASKVREDTTPVANRNHPHAVSSPNGNGENTVPSNSIPTSSQPAAPGTPLQLGEEAYKARNWSGAASSFALHLQSNPEDTDVKNKLGWAYFRGNQVSKAFQIWQEMMRSDEMKELGRENFLKAKLETAQSLRKRRMMNPALVQLKDALKIAPDSPEILNELGDLYAEKNDFINAATYFEKVLEANPNDKHARASLKRVRTKLRSSRVVR